MVKTFPRLSGLVKKTVPFTLLASIASLLVGCDMMTTPMTTLGVVTDWGRDINHVYLITTVITSIIGVVIAGLMVYVIWRFREKPGDETIPKQVHGNFKLELLWSIIPVILLLFIMIPTLEVIFKYDTSKKPENAMTVKVIGHQFWWEFQYPDLGINSANEIHLPENTTIFFEITSADVIHSFWIPKFGGKIDALPGEKAVNHLIVTTPMAEKDGGDYYQGQCVELCGLSHALMRFQAVVHKKDEFERWAQSYKNPPVVETSKEKRGLELMTTKGCIGCHYIEGTIAAGRIGPDLTQFGNRKMIAAGVLHNNQADIATWLKDPPALKPGSLMLNLGLSDEEISDLTAFLRNSTYKHF